MPTQHTGSPTKTAVTFVGACSLVETAIAGAFRREIVADASKAKDLGAGLQRLRDAIGSNVLRAGANHVDLSGLVKQYDSQTRLGGFHVLHDWDGKADKVTDACIAVEVIDYVRTHRGTEPCDRTVLAIVVDYYLLYVLALLSLRIWDEGDADENLDRLTPLLRELQGPNGSGQRFVDDVETLILIATSHYELENWWYDELLERVKGLSHAHRLKIAIGHAGSLGCHLRFGFEATYGRDTVLMREDNVADYPWLCFSVATLMREYARMHRDGVHGPARETIVEGILSGLSPDARAFVGDPPASLAPYEDDRSEFCELFLGHREDLMEEFEPHRPLADVYSPLSFFFNFSQNALKGMVVDALLRGEPWDLTLNDLLTGLPRGEPKAEVKQTLATKLMGYARDHPDTIRGRLMPAIVYDPRTGRRIIGIAMRKMKA